MRTLRMKMIRKSLASAGILAALISSGVALAQTNFVTSTNYVVMTNYITVTVTNVVIMTNAVQAPISVTAPVVVTPTKVKYSWNSSVSAGLTLTRGNSDTMLFTADFLTQKKTPFDEYKIGMDAAYGSQQGSETVNNYKAFTQWNHLFTDRFYGYLRVDGLRDIIADVNYRATIGPGLGYYLIKTTNMTFSVEGGGAFEAQRLDNSGDDTFATLRLSDQFEYKLNDRVRIWQNAEILPQVDKFDNYIVNFEIGIEAALTKSFSLKSYLDDSYDNRPAPGKLKNDAKLVTAVSYKF